MATMLPSGVSARTFAAATGELERALGRQWVVTAPGDLEPYRDPHGFGYGGPQEYLPGAVVTPGSVEEVQAVVRIANQHKVPLYPISLGKNLTYGGAAPTLSGSVIVDLKRLNRILEVDDKRNFALVEPGVSYFDLYRYIQEHKLKLWIDCPATGWGSLVGNALDHGVGYTASAFRDHFGSHCGMEVVLPTGEVMRTGMGALPGAQSWQEHKYGVGPSVDGLFAQSNFGIVTKMGFWLMPEPEAWLAASVSVTDYTDLPALIEHTNYLEDAQITNGKPSYNSSGVHLFEGRFPSASPRVALSELMADGWPTIDRIKNYSLRHGGPAWRVALQFYGPEKVIQAQWDYVMNRARAALPGCTLAAGAPLRLPLPAPPPVALQLVDFGVPNLSVFTRTAAEAAAFELHGPGQDHVDFMAIIPRSAEAVFKAQRVLYDTQKAMGAPVTMTPFHAPTAWFHRSFMMGAPTVALFKGDPEQNAKARALYAAYVTNMAAAGFSAYRTNPAMQDLVAAQFSFNDHALLRFQERLKDAADPNGILAPGRYGVWPQNRRKKGNPAAS